MTTLTCILNTHLRGNECSVLLTAGYIILRGWCETADTDNKRRESSINPKESWCAQKLKRRREASHGKTGSKKDNRMILWFEVDDTGCGMPFVKESGYKVKLS